MGARTRGMCSGWTGLPTLRRSARVTARRQAALAGTGTGAEPTYACACFKVRAQHGAAVAAWMRHCVGPSSSV